MAVYNPSHADRVWERATISGTGNVTLANTAVAGYRTFNAALAVGDLVEGDRVGYCIVDTVTNEWEIGAGIIAAPSSILLSRDVVLRSSNSNVAVAFANHACDVFVTPNAGRIDRGMLPFVSGRWYSAPGSSGGAAPGTATLTAHPLRWRGPATPEVMGIRCTTAPSAAINVSLGIYDGRSGVPGALLASFGSPSVSAAGFSAASASVARIDTPNVFCAVGTPAATNSVQLAALGAGYNNANSMLADSLGSTDASASPVFGYTAAWTPGALPANFPVASMDPAAPIIRAWVKV